MPYLGSLSLISTLLPDPPDRPTRRERLRTRSRKWTRVAIVAAAAGALVAGAACAAILLPEETGDSAAANADPTASSRPRATTSTVRRVTTTTRAPTTTTTLPAMPDPAFMLLPDVAAGGIGQGTNSPVVQMFEERLAALQFDPGAVDGSFDSATRYAIETVQKLAGLPRTGRIGPAERLYLMAFKFPAPMAGADREAKRIEIDLDRQVLVLWDHHLIRLITTTSTGDGDYFCGGDDGCQYAVTPPGKFAVQREVRGWKKGKLGTLYNPVYFNGGIAVHGYSSVPTAPASHGCSRIPMHIAEYFQGLVDVGDVVYVFGTPSGPTGGAPQPPAATTTAPPATTVPPATTAPPGTTATTPPSTTTTAPSTTTTAPPTTTTAPAPTTTT